MRQHKTGRDNKHSRTANESQRNYYVSSRSKPIRASLCESNPCGGGGGGGVVQWWWWSVGLRSLSELVYLDTVIRHMFQIQALEPAQTILSLIIIVLIRQLYLIALHRISGRIIPKSGISKRQAEYPAEYTARVSKQREAKTLCYWKLTEQLFIA